MGQADEESAVTKAASCVCPQSEAKAAREREDWEEREARRAQ